MTVVVASVPTDHVYVRHLAPPDGGGGVRRFGDRPSRPGRESAWWPPQVLDPAWVEQHAEQVDVVHVHFGFDGSSPDELAAWVACLRRHRLPLVVTVHDLRNPHHPDPEPHSSQLAVLLDAADAVLTLTPGAAAEVRRRFGREARVLPHPHVVPPDLLARPRPHREGSVVGIHCKSLRAGMDPLPVVRGAVEAVAHFPGARLQVDVHDDVMAADGAHHDPHLAAALTDLAEDGALDLRVGPYRAEDRAFFDYLASVDVSVLPYRFGTHSGWLEACHDLGTTVLAPDCGYYAQQRPCVTYPTGDAAGVTAALRRVLRRPPTWRASAADRFTERTRIAAAHEEVYAQVLGRTAADPSHEAVAACTS